MGKPVDQGSGPALSALSTDDAGKSVTVNEVDLGGGSDAASANGSLPAAGPAEQALTPPDNIFARGRRSESAINF